MKIIYKVGNLLDAPEPVIVHGCNAQGVMGSGIAKAIRAKYPRAYTEYRRIHEARGLRLGECIWVECGQHMIVDAITQRFYGREPGRRYVDYDAVRECMVSIDNDPYFRESLEVSEGLLSVPRVVAMPRIGASLGGGDWRTIALIIEDSFHFVQPVVYTLADESAKWQGSGAEERSEDTRAGRVGIAGR